SRRRHTRSYGDWSSDVCSSDLARDADGEELRVIGIFDIRIFLRDHANDFLARHHFIEQILRLLPANIQWHHRAGEDNDVADRQEDRKSTRLNSSHRTISYAVFC